MKFILDVKYILVAEDDDFNFLVIESLLLSKNYVVLRACNGEEAVNHIKTQNHKISLILMDIQMPVMDGLTATEEIRKINEKIPIVIQTSYAIDKVKEKAFESGCNDFLSKPVTMETLIPKVEKYAHF